ncbi:MAG TPA: class I SAM-dependent methyltransferase [Gemmataceae bacterium]|jgi:SAM-dependent methyltransferase
MLARIRQWRRLVKRSLSYFRPGEGSARAEPEPSPAAIAPRSRTMREAFAWEYLKGDGLEIGALHRPLPLPPNARVRYVDRLDVEGLRTHYPELKDLPLVRVDIIDDGEKLSCVPDGSQDFVVANHFIEHTQDPIGTIRRFLDVLKPGGILFMVVPDKRGTFDKQRSLTPVEHIYRDYEEGPDSSCAAHYYEWVEKVWGDPTGRGIEAEAKRQLEMKFSIHFHVWTHTTFWEMLMAIRGRYAMPFDIYALFYNQPESESIVVLSKT